VSTTMLTPENAPLSFEDDIAREIVHHGDPVLGFARVITQVHTNANVFRGWGPKVLA
jgi:hypothetical protein